MAPSKVAADFNAMINAGMEGSACAGTTLLSFTKASKIGNVARMRYSPKRFSARIGDQVLQELGLAIASLAQSLHLPAESASQRYVVYAS